MKKVFSIGVCLFVFSFVVAQSAHAGFNGRYPKGGNSIRIENSCETTVVQSNTSVITNGVVAVANTGGNTIVNTVKGNPTITTGVATTTVTITNTTGGNVALVSGCCCGGCGTCSNQPTGCQL